MQFRKRLNPTDMMIYISGLVGFLLVLTAEAKVGDSSNVPFCTETDQCLLFNETCNNDCYEVRHYGSFKLVSTGESSWIMWIALMRSFRRLYAYITGENSDGAQIKMAAPVIIRMEDKDSFKKKYTMSFVLPAEHQANPPKPDDDDVFVEELTDVNVYVKTFGGWITTWNINQNVESLAACLKADGVEFNENYHYVAGYNSPMTTTDRHNEVWLVAAGAPKCSSNE